METLFDCIVNRRSIRKYLPQHIEDEKIKEIITAACYAPSGNNIQPWKFVVIQNDLELKDRIASLTIFKKWVNNAPCVILVYLDKNDYTDKIFNCDLKHKQAIGAAIQNILLSAYEMNIGTCWIGEILKREKEVNEAVGVSDSLELMAMITIGYYEKTTIKAKRKTMDEIVLKWK